MLICTLSRRPHFNPFFWGYILLLCWRDDDISKKLLNIIIIIIIIIILLLLLGRRGGFSDSILISFIYIYFHPY